MADLSFHLLLAYYFHGLNIFLFQGSRLILGCPPATSSPPWPCSTSCPSASPFSRSPCPFLWKAWPAETGCLSFWQGRRWIGAKLWLVLRKPIRTTTTKTKARTKLVWPNGLWREPPTSWRPLPAKSCGHWRKFKWTKIITSQKCSVRRRRSLSASQARRFLGRLPVPRWTTSTLRSIPERWPSFPVRQVPEKRRSSCRWSTKWASSRDASTGSLIGGSLWSRKSPGKKIILLFWWSFILQFYWLLFNFSIIELSFWYFFWS